MSNSLQPSKNQTVAYGLGLASRWMFAATLVLIPVRYRFILQARPLPPVYRDYTDYLLFAADATLLLTLALWVLSLAIARRRPTLGPGHIWIPLAGLTLAGWISSLSSYDPGLSVYHAIRLFILFWFYVYIVNEIRLPGWALIPVGLQVLIQSLVALAQFIAQRSVDLPGIGELYLDPAWPGTSVVVANGVRLLRAYGLSDHPNILGGCLAFGLLLLLAAYLHRPGFPPLLIASLPAVPALLVTFSRSAWLALAVGMLVLLAVEVWGRRWTQLKASAWLIPLILCTLAPFLIAYSRFFGARLNVDQSFSTPSVEQQSIGERFLLIRSFTPILLQHPLLGTGLGTAPQALKAYDPSFPVGYEPPHLAIMDAGLETGLLGLLSYLALIILPIVIFFKYRRSLIRDPYVTTAFALLLAVTVVGFFDYYTWMLVPGRLWQWLAWGLWAAAVQRTAIRPETPGQPSP